MRKFMTVAACLACVGLLVHGSASAEQATTGDRKFDSTLRAIDEQAQGDPEGYVRHLSQKFGVPEQELVQAREQHRLTYGDTFMAAALARRTNRRVGEVAAEYRKSEGQGWGTMAQNMGIKPGSAEFKHMKGDAKGSAGHMKSMNRERNRHRLNEQQLDREKPRTQSQGAGGGSQQGQGKGQGKGKKK